MMLKSEVTHSKPNNPKIAIGVPCKTLSGPAGINGVKFSRLICVKQSAVVASKEKTVNVIKMYCPS